MPDLFRHPPHGTLVGMRERQPCVYILASARNGTLYVGVTSDLLKRLAQHRTGAVPGFTSTFGVHRLVYYELHETMPLAITREKAMKRWRREWKMNLIERENPHWSDLALHLGFDPLPTG